MEVQDRGTLGQPTEGLLPCLGLKKIQAGPHPPALIPLIPRLPEIQPLSLSILYLPKMAFLPSLQTMYCHQRGRGASPLFFFNYLFILWSQVLVAARGIF